MPTKDMQSEAFIYGFGTTQQEHGVYYGGKTLVLVSWINMEQI